MTLQDKLKNQMNVAVVVRGSFSSAGCIFEPGRMLYSLGFHSAAAVSRETKYFFKSDCFLFSDVPNGLPKVMIGPEALDRLVREAHSIEIPEISELLENDHNTPSLREL